MASFLPIVLLASLLSSCGRLPHRERMRSPCHNDFNRCQARIRTSCFEWDSFFPNEDCIKTEYWNCVQQHKNCVGLQPGYK